jgi:hypothetical protein
VVVSSFATGGLSETLTLGCYAFDNTWYIINILNACTALGYSHLVNDFCVHKLYASVNTLNYVGGYQGEIIGKNLYMYN